MARGLSGTQTTAVRKGGENVSVAGIFNLGTEPGREPEVSAPLRPVFSIRNRCWYGSLRYALHELLLQIDGGCRYWHRSARRHDRLAVFAASQISLPLIA